MIDRRSMTDPANLSGTDFVLEGASVRDRFLTAFVLQHNGALTSAWQQTSRLPAPAFSGDARLLMSEPASESFNVRVEAVHEPLAVRVIDDCFSADDDDEM